MSKTKCENCGYEGDKTAKDSWDWDKHYICPKCGEKKLSFVSNIMIGIRHKTGVRRKPASYSKTSKK